MANDLVWDKRMVRIFADAAFLTEEEQIVLDDWAKGKSIVNTSMMRNMSERKVNYIRKNIRTKYDRVQVYTPDLPKRITRSV
jgi:hypothetical protein